MKHLMRRAVVACVVAGTVAGSLALSAPSAGALVPSPNPPTNLTVYKQGTSTASATALDVLDVSIADDSTPPYLPIDTANGNPRLEFTKSGNRTVYVAVTATGPKAGTAVLPVLPETGLWHVNLLVGDVVDGGMNFTYTAESWTCAVGVPATDGTNKFCEQRFTASGTWTVPTDVTSFDFLVVGGGGGGGGGMTYNYFNPALPGAGAGGGGGEVTVCANQSAVPGNDQWTVTVGSGGAAGALRTGGSASPGADGGASSIVLPAEAQCLAAGGVGGESAGNGAGSGGPSRVVHVVTPLPRGAATPPGGNGGASGNANAGGTGANSQYNSIDRTVAGGGGGGSGAVGSNGSGGSPALGGAGGAGTNPTGSFADLVYTFGGGGGGGAGDDVATDGTGGRGWFGGGNGGTCSSGTCSGGYEASGAGNTPEANSGGGGGGGTGSSEGPAAAGAAGIVIVRWAAPQTATLYVHQTNTIGSGSCASPDFATIAGAIAAAATGDTIVVCSGTYQEGALVVPGSITELTIKGEVYPAPADPTVFPAVGPQADAPILDGRSLTTPADDSLRVRILDAPDTFLHLENLTFQYGASPSEQSTTAGGGGVRAKRVSLDHTSFVDNEATRCADGGCGDYLDRGGAVLAVDAAPANTEEAPTVDIDSSTFDDNAASFAGGAVASSGYVLVNGSAFDGNSVSNSGVFAHGGAISTGATDNGGSLVSAAPVTAISSSFTNNSIVKAIGESASIGSAIAAGQFNGLAEDILLINSTVAGNTAEAGYAVTLYGSNVFVRFSTVVNNTLTGVSKAVFVANSSTVIGGSLFTRDGGAVPCEVTTYVDLGSNVTDVSTCTPDATTQVVADVAAMKLGTLGEQGTSGTKSYPLEADSPAVDFADCDLDGALTAALAVDQNGIVRPQGAKCDAGAVEHTAVEDTPVCTSFTNRTTNDGLGNNVVNGVFASGSTIYAATTYGLSISTDGGTTFTNMSTNGGLGLYGVYASGSTIYAATTYGLSISTDGGTTWTNKTDTDGLGASTVFGVYASGTTIYAAISGGLSISTNGGTNWTNKTTTDGLGANDVYGVYASGTTIYAATSGGLSISTDGGTNWTNKTTDDGLGSNIVRSVFASGNNVYAATSTGLSINDGCGDAVWIERNGAPVTTGDSCETPPYTSITAAVAAAQADDIIHVCSGTYRETEINVTVDNLTILGEEYPAGSGNETIINGELTDGDATTRHRILDARGLAITFENVTLQNGVAAASSDYGSYGGAVYAYQVTVIDSEMKDNDAAGGGAVFVSADGYVPPCGPVAGLTESNAGCAPVEPAVTVGPSVTVTRSTFDGNGDAATTIIGGAIYAMGGTVTAVESTFDGNEALARTSPTPADTDGAGGAIQADSVSVFGSTFTNNAAYLHGGAISASTVNVAASTDGQASLFSLNTADGDGDVDTVDNGYGGAIWADAVEVADTTFANNSADFGGAIASAAGSDQRPVTPGVPTSSSVAITRSLFESNSATVDGGGVFNLADPGSTTLENVTLTLNSAGNAGGGVYAQSTLTVELSTFHLNTAVVSGGVLFTIPEPTLSNNIFSYDVTGDGSVVNGCNDWNGWPYPPTTSTNNFTSSDWCAGTVTADADLDLQALADNGGLTETIALGENSVAIDTVDTISCNPESSDTDQRGVARPIGDTCDAGAFEYFGDIDLGDGGQDPGVVHTLEVPDGVSTVYALLVGGGGPGGNSNDDEATGGGGGGEVKECAVEVSAGDVVTYRIGEGGTDGDWGGSSWVAVNYDYDPLTFDPALHTKCYAAGGKNGASEGGSGGESGNSNLGGAGLCPEPCVAGGGGGGAGSVGTPGLEEPVRGGAGGAGVSPSAAFGDISTVFGGGGGGGATGYFCLAATAGAGGAGGGGAGAEESLCDSGAPVSPGSYAGTDSADGTDGTGGGGGGAGGSYGPGEGGSGTAMFRTPVVPEPEGESLHICVYKRYVIYGARYYEPKVSLCVPITDPCATTPGSTGGSPVSQDPECCPAAPVDGSDPNHCDLAPDSTESPSDGYSTISGDQLIDSGSVSELDDDEHGEEGLDTLTLLPTPTPLHYEHGIPEGWRKASLDEFPGVVLPTCVTEYEPGDDVNESDPTGMPITCEGGDPTEGYVFDYEFLSDGLRIHPAVLTVKPRHLRVPYGTPEPDPYEFTVKGFKLGETADDADEFEAPDCDSDYDPATASAGDRFYIICSGGSAKNYTFRYKSSHIHVDKQRVNLRPADVTITYGDSVPSVAWSVSGLRGPESALAPDRLAGFVAPTCSTDFEITDGAGEYDIDCEGASSTNFEFVAEPATLTVNKATLTVLPSSASVTYGSGPAHVGFALSGYVNGETVPGSGYQAPRCLAPSYTSTTPAGSLLTVECTGGSSRNYMFDVSSKAVLAVTKAHLVVVPDSKSAVYGSSAPVYTFRTTGWRNGESPLTNPAGLVMPVCGSSYAPTDNAGSISSIVCTGGSADNYDFDTQATGTVTVAKAVLTVVADSQSTTYAQAAPALTATVSGFVNGEGPATAAGFAAPSCTSAYVVGANAGNYPITCSGGTSANYAFSYVSGSLSVAKVMLSAVPGNASVVYGTSSHPSVPLTVSGFVAGQTVSTASGYRAPSCSLAGYTSATNAGTYTITCSGGTAANYTFDTSATSTLTVTKAPATITATSRNVTYGSATPAWAFTVSGLRNGQTATTVAGMVAPVCSSGYSALSNAGTIAPVSCSGASSANYNFTYVAGKATVTKAVLTVTANSLTITKGSAVPAYTNVITGWQNGQGPATAAGYVRPICKSSYSTRSAIGNYTISCSGGSATNYTFTYRSGVLSVR